MILTILASFVSGLILGLALKSDRKTLYKKVQNALSFFVFFSFLLFWLIFFSCLCAYKSISRLLSKVKFS